MAKLIADNPELHDRSERNDVSAIRRRLRYLPVPRPGVQHDYRPRIGLLESGQREDQGRRHHGTRGLKRSDVAKR